MILLKGIKKLFIILFCYNDDILLSLILINNIYDSYFFLCKFYIRRLVKKNVC